MEISKCSELINVIFLDWLCCTNRSSFAKDLGTAGIDGPLGPCDPRILPTIGENSWLLFGSRDWTGDAMPPNLSSLIWLSRHILMVVYSTNRRFMSWLIDAPKFISNSENVQMWPAGQDQLRWHEVESPLPPHLWDSAAAVLSRLHLGQILHRVQLMVGFDQVTGFFTYCSF